MLTVEINRHIEEVHPYIPAKGLLAAILERAYRDLSPQVSHLTRVQAVAWFRSTISDDAFSFTFKRVAQALDLSKSNIDFIMIAVDAAEDLNESQIRAKNAQKS